MISKPIKTKILYDRKYDFKVMYVTLLNFKQITGEQKETCNIHSRSSCNYFNI